MILRAAALVAALTVCSPAFADDQADIKVRGSDFQSALNSGDLDALAGLYTEDAMALPPGTPIVQGREAIRAMWQDAIGGGMGGVDLEPVELTVVDDTAYEVGTFDATVTEEGTESPARGKFVVIWKKVDGDWMLHRDIWNMTPVEE